MDTHQHLWDLARFKLAWIQKDSPLTRSFVMKDYLTAVNGLNVVKAVYMEVDVDPAQQPAEADYVRTFAGRARRRLPRPWFPAGPASTEFAKYLDRFKGNAYIKGIARCCTAGDAGGFCLEPAFVAASGCSAKAAQLRSVHAPADLRRRHQASGSVSRYALHSRSLRQRQRPGQGPHPMAARHDRVRQAQERGCKVSGIVVTGPARQVERGRSGPHRQPRYGRVRLGSRHVRRRLAGLHLGGTFRQWVEALKTIVRNRPAADQRKLFHDNAAKFYGLKA